MNIMRIPTRYEMQVSFLTDEQRHWVFDSIWKLSCGHDVDQTMTPEGALLEQVWRDAEQMESRNVKKDGKPVGMLVRCDTAIEENRIEEKRKEENILSSPSAPRLSPPLVENSELKGEPESEKEIVPRFDNIKEIVSYLNEKSGKDFRYQSKATQGHINARLKEGFTVDDAKRVIELKCSEWKGDRQMEQYIRPQTLFSGKFESYLQSAPKTDNKPKINEW